MLSDFGNEDSLVQKTNGAVDGKIRFQVGANDNDVQILDMNFYKEDKTDVRTKNTDTVAKVGGSYSLENLMKAAGLKDPGSGSASFKVNTDGTTKGTPKDYTVFDVRSSKAAQATLATIDDVIKLIDTKRGDFGALENRMSSTISNQTNIMNNESDARSRIRDTDYAEEASNLSAQSIVQQAASSMLTQANSLPQMALSLLAGLSFSQTGNARTLRTPDEF